MPNRTKPVQFSPVYDRYNGVMLGLFLQLGGVRASRQRYPALRLRMQQFASELNLAVEFPEDPGVFSEQRGELHNALFSGLREKSSEMTLAFGIGYCLGAEIIEGVVEEHGFLSKLSTPLGVDPGRLIELATALKREGTSAHIDGIMTQGLELVEEMLRPVEVEPDTCFVALPFEETFLERSVDLFQPLLKRFGFRAFPAWGGVASEAHHGALLTLIDRCGAIFADLSGQNPNVLYELGFAVGRGKRWFAVLDVATVPEGAPAKPSNLRGQAVLPYDSNKLEWQAEFRDKWGPRYLDAALKVYGETAEAVKSDSILSKIRRLLPSSRS